MSLLSIGGENREMGESDMTDKFARKTGLGVSVCVALMLAAGSGSAMAGEITGNGKSLKDADGHLNGRSECAFSGLNDTYSGDPSVPDEDGFFRTQNWGQLSKSSKASIEARSLSVQAMSI